MMCMAQTVRPHISIEVSGNNQNLKTNVDSAFGDWGENDGGADIIARVRSGTGCGSASAGSGQVSLNIGAFTEDKHKIILVNDGYIDGRGGSGGAGGATTPTVGSPGGSASGTALLTTVNMDIVNNGNIRQGGGGGGGGGGAQTSDGKTCANHGVGAGGAGGSGAGNGSGASGGSAGPFGGASGGSGGSFGSAGGAGNSGTTHPESCGTQLGGGNGGASDGFYLDGASKVTWIATGTRTGNTQN